MQNNSSFLEDLFNTIQKKAKSKQFSVDFDCYFGQTTSWEPQAPRAARGSARCRPAQRAAYPLQISESTAVQTRRGPFSLCTSREISSSCQDSQI